MRGWRTEGQRVEPIAKKDTGNIDIAQEKYDKIQKKNCFSICKLENRTKIVKKSISKKKVSVKISRLDTNIDIFGLLF